MEKKFQKEEFSVSRGSMELLMEETGTRLSSTHVIGEDLPGREKNTHTHRHKGWTFGEW